MLTAMSLLRYGNGYIWTMMSTTEPYTLLLHGAPQSPHLLLLLKLYCAPALSAVWCYRQCQCYTSTLKQYSASTPNCTLNYAQPTQPLPTSMYPAYIIVLALECPTYTLMSPAMCCFNSPASLPLCLLSAVSHRTCWSEAEWGRYESDTVHCTVIRILATKTI